MKNVTIDSAQDDLIIVRDDLLSQGRPSEKNLDQLLYDQEVLTKLISEVEDVSDAHNIANLLKTINKVLNTTIISKNVKPFGNNYAHVLVPERLIGQNVVILELKD